MIWVIFYDIFLFCLENPTNMKLTNDRIFIDVKNVCKKNIFLISILIGVIAGCLLGEYMLGWILTKPNHSMQIIES